MTLAQEKMFGKQLESSGFSLTAGPSAGKKSSGSEPKLLHHYLCLENCSWISQDASQFCLRKILIQILSLVVEDNVRPPDDFWGNTDGGDIFIFLRVPAELVIIPLLQENIHHFKYSSFVPECIFSVYFVSLSSPDILVSPRHWLSSSGSSHPE